MFLPEPTQREIPPAGAHIARCWQFIDFGTQETNFQGQLSWKHQVQIGWEIPEELMKDGRPFGAFKTYTWSMNEKATFRKDLESWRGRRFGEDDFRGPNRFNVKNLIGAGCVLTIIHKDSHDGTKVFANISAISPIPKGMSKLADPINKPIFLGLTEDSWNVETFQNLPEWMREKIAKSPEYGALLGKPSPPPRQLAHADLDDEVPF